MYDVCDVPASMWTIYLGKKNIFDTWDAPRTKRTRRVASSLSFVEKFSSKGLEAAKAYRAVAKNGVYSNWLQLKRANDNEPRDFRGA